MHWRFGSLLPTIAHTLVEILWTKGVFYHWLFEPSPYLKGMRGISASADEVMITGDYLKTAIAIAKNVQILQPQDDGGEAQSATFRRLARQKAS